MTHSGVTRERQRIEGIVLLASFIASIWLANWLITHWGTERFGDGPWLVPVWPGFLTPSGDTIYAPSGVLAIGLSFTLRDLVQRRLGLLPAVAAIIAGAALSAALDTSLALASGLAFLVAESLDLFVYTPIQRRNLVVAVIASNLVGILVDSAIFLRIAFGSLDLLEGQVIGKAWMTLLAVPLIWGLRSWDDRRGYENRSFSRTFLP
jgi:queuosine precursor transporter